MCYNPSHAFRDQRRFLCPSSRPEKGKSATMITVMLVDDHKLMREGLRALIESHEDLQVVGEAENGRTAVDLAARLTPDVIIMDISMPGLNGIEATRRIVEVNTEVRVIALSMHLERRTALAMLSAGAAGYLLKDCASEEVVNAIHAVRREGIYLSPKVADLILQDYLVAIAQGEASPLARLSTKEREVLQLIGEGRRNREIADIMEVSIRTVEFHRKQLMEKLNIRSTADMVKLAIREGLVTL